ncbi:MAG TPA: O-antigen ligase family protein [Candidatus Polarisedimenticolia bacterium]|nr:O-antigen ligase family protein [Candidatus Polarisedimenticolia bacterium]
MTTTKGSKLRDFPAVSSALSADRLLLSSGIISFALLLCVLNSVGCKAAILLLIASIALFALLNFPEVSFALFVNAGMYKADEALESYTKHVDLTLLFLAISLCGILWNLIKGRLSLRLPSRQLLIPYVVVVVLAAISLAFTLAPIYAGEKFARLAILTTSAFIFPALLFQDSKRIGRFFGTYVILTLAMVFAVLFNDRLQLGVYGQQEAFGSGYLGLGSVTSQGTLILLTYFLFRTKSVWGRLLVFVVAIIDAFGIFVSGARGSAIAFLVALGVLFIWSITYSLRRLPGQHNLNRRSPKALIVLGVFVVTVAISIWVFRDYFVTILARTEDLVYSASVVENERVDMYHKSLQFLATSSRSLYGLGLGGWSMFYYGFDAPRGGFPHNLFLEVGVELGWPGLISFGLMLYAAFRAGVIALERSSPGQFPISIGVMTLFVYMCGYSSFHGDINDCRQLFLWMCAIDIARMKSPESPERTSSVQRRSLPSSEQNV